ncbi:MAG: TonB-dependent receptor [Solitalea sp.]
MRQKILTVSIKACVFLLAMALPSIQPVHADPILVTWLQGPVSGKVVDENGLPLPGVSIRVQGSSEGTSTDENGVFSLNASQGDVLEISFIGYKQQTVTVGPEPTLHIALEPDRTSLEEVVVTGYMTQRKADLTGAISVISRDDFVKAPSANVLRSLQGKIPGVHITTNGNPAEQVGVQVRGITSINSSPPLIVLDGQPVTINLRDINPNDIESIQFLRDAASASIYGSRAAGGVILVNTRQGKKGEARVMYESYIGISRITGVPRMLNAEEYGRALWQATVNDGDDPNTAIQIYDYDWSYNEDGVPVLHSVTPREWLNEEKTMPSSNTNWFDAGTRTGIQQNHQLTISGGSERLSSLFSLNYYNNQGTQITSFFRRLAARFNNEYELIEGRLTVGENLTLTNLKMRDVNSTYGFLVMPPNIPVYDLNGGWGGVAMPLGMDDFANPVRGLEINKDNTPNFMKVLGTAYANLKILDNLSLRTQFGVDYSMWYDRTIQHKWEEAGGKSNPINGVTQNSWHNLGQTWTNTLTYNLELDDHRIDLLGGMETYRFVDESYRGYREDILLEDRDYAYLSTATGDRRELVGGGGERALLSYFGKVNYAFSSKYLLSATLRYDGASVFGENNRFGTFPAFSAGWRISEEPFMENAGLFSDLKLRASWGQNGNSAPLSAGRLVNIYVTDVNGTSYAIGGNETGSIPSGYRRASLGNPDLKWETTTQTNIGVDFGLFGHRLTGSFDWFHKKTNDMLFEPPYIGALGEGGFRWVNAADMTNKGFELVVSWAESGREFSYNIAANLSAYTNKINSIPENVKYTYGGNGLLDNIIGRPLNSFYGLVADGIFKTQEEVSNSPQQQGKGIGRIRYKDLDGDGVINETYDRTWIGVRDPDLMAGLNFGARYKQFDVTIFMQGVFGNDVYNSWKELSDFWNIGVQNDRNHPSRILNAWSPLNPNSDIPAMSRRDANGEKRLSTYFIENGSYVKLRTVDIGYTFPSNVIEHLRLSRLRLYISAQNIFTLKKTWGKDRFTGGDPENPGTGYPLPFNAYFGVNVTF